MLVVDPPDSRDDAAADGERHQQNDHIPRPSRFPKLEYLPAEDHPEDSLRGEPEISGSCDDCEQAPSRILECRRGDDKRSEGEWRRHEGSERQAESRAAPDPCLYIGSLAPGQVFLQFAFAAIGIVRASSNRYLFSASDGDSVNLWSVRLAPPDWKGEDLRRLTYGTQTELQPAVAGNRIAFTAETDSAQIFSNALDANGGKIKGPLEQLTNGNRSTIPELSRDGKKLSYVSARPGEMRAIVGDLASGQESVVLGAPQIHHPTLSPDGAQLAYRIPNGPDAGFYVAPSTGGSAQKLCGADCGMALSWTNDSRQVMFKMGSKIGLMEVPGGRQILLLDHGNDQLWQPHLSADGQWVVFVISYASDRHSIAVAPFRPGVKAEDWITAVPAGAENDKPRWSPDGRLIYFTSTRDGYRCIWAQRLNADKTPAGPPFAVLHSIAPRAPCPT